MKNKTREALALAIIKPTDEDGCSPMTIKTLNTLLDEIETIYAPILQKEFDDGQEHGEKIGRSGQ